MNDTWRRISTVVLVVVAVTIGLTPLYTTFWWWDVLAHALCTAALVRVLRELGCNWEESLFLLIGLSLLFEVFEYHVPLFITGYLDTLVDLSVNVATWGVIRAAAAVEVRVPTGVPTPGRPSE